jgi:electron transport complex protein RnfE
VAEIPYSTIARDGLWRNNAALVQLLGLCPLLAVSNSVVNSIGLGAATLLVLVGSNVIVSLVRHRIPPEVRIPVFVLVIASFVTVVDLTMSAYWHQLHGILGIFIPLIVVNCNIIGRAEAFASKHPVDRALVDGLTIGLGFAFALVALGALREIIGHGTLLAQAHLMFGPGTEWMTLSPFQDYPGFLLAVLPPGAFIGLGLLIALKNTIDRRQAARAARRITVKGLAKAGA